MALNNLTISNLNPLKFVQRGYASPLPYNWRYMDDYLFGDTILPFQERAAFLQPFQNNDIIYLQFLSNYNPHQVEVTRCDGVVIDTFQMVYKASSIEASGLKAYEASIALSSYPEGVYQLVVRSGVPVISVIESEWFHIKELHESSLVLHYLHTKNAYDVAFGTGIEFRFRIPGSLGEYSPGANRVVYIDQPNNIVQLSGRSFHTQKLYIGGPLGVPDWVAGKVNDIFLCSHVSIDGRQYVAAEGAKMEPVREQNYPMAGWGIEVRPAAHKTGKKFSADGSLVPASSVVYNIDTAAFGSISQPAGSNIVQIESTD